MLGALRDTINLAFWQGEKVNDFDMDIFGQQSIGKRPRQEDCYRAISIIDPAKNKDSDKRNPRPATLIVVCDGMGGHVGGQVASKQAAESFVNQFTRCQGSIIPRLETATYHANDCLRSTIDKHPDLAGMGTTLLAVVVKGNELYWVSIGDSPLWLVRENRISRLNEDHSMAPVFEEMASRGVVRKEDIENDPRRHALRSSMSGNEIHLIDMPRIPLILKKGDQIVLSTDGLETINIEDILSILVSESYGSSADRLSQLFFEIEQLDHPYQDNTTTVLMNIQK